MSEIKPLTSEEIELLFKGEWVNPSFISIVGKLQPRYLNKGGPYFFQVFASQLHEIELGAKWEAEEMRQRLIATINATNH